MFQGRFYKSSKQRVSVSWRRGKLWVKLATYKPWVIWHLYDLYQHAIHRSTRYLKASILQDLDIGVVDLVTMPVTLDDHLFAVARKRR